MPRDFSKELKKEWKILARKFLKEIDDEVILKYKRLSGIYKVYALRLKNNNDIKKNISVEDGKIYYNDTCVINLIKTMLSIKILEIRNGVLNITGTVTTFLPEEDYNIYVSIDKKEQKLELKPTEYGKKVCMDEEIVKLKEFSTKIKLKPGMKINFLFEYKDEGKEKLEIGFGEYAKMVKKIKNSYYAHEDFLIKKNKNTLKVSKNTLKNRLKREAKYIYALLKIKKMKIIFYRILYFISIKPKKKIWLFFDRTNVAGDNGEYLFEYVCKQKNPNIKPYFVIEKTSQDYKKLKQHGKVIKYGSIKHKLYLLMSSKIVSSQVSEEIGNIFLKDGEYIKDLYNYDFIFIQHGVLYNDCSKWLNKLNKNLKFFLTTGKREYKEVLELPYEYDESVVKLTGMPRYDKLESEPKNKIVIMPTWRRKITMWRQKGVNEYNPKFKNTEFYKFYNGLLTNERLLDCLKKNGFKIKLCLHPNMISQAKDFESSDLIEINQGVADYSKEFKEANLFVTDFSSTFYDFSYLKKPVIHALFDLEEFYSDQVYDKGVFDFEKEGFGPVCYDLESTVDKIINYIENDCKIEKVYLDRINNFYYSFDKDNCKRVYEEILNLEEE